MKEERSYVQVKCKALFYLKELKQKTAGVIFALFLDEGGLL
jgi:hypothetical protein